MADYQLFDVKVTLLTPLHIGSGRDLLYEYDYDIFDRRTWRINEDALLDAQDVDDPALANRLAQTPPAQLLDKPADFRSGSPMFRYVIQGTPRSRQEGAQVREQLKDAYDRPYLPGTSLKGALRTALAWVAWGERKLSPARANLGRSPKFAAQWYEQELFSTHSGKAPNYDLLRALHVGDSAPVDMERLMLVNARVLHRSGQMASPIELEALCTDTVFQLPLKVDTALFSEWARQRGLKLRGEGWLRHLAQTVQRHTAHRLQQESAWFAKVPDARRIVDFYRQLPQSLPPNICLLQLGWGTGWEDKTLGSHLQADADFMEDIMRPTKQGGYGLARGTRKHGDPFPKSRRVLIKVQRAQDGHTREVPISPLGWVLMEIQPVT